MKKQIEYGLQLFSLHDMAEHDMEGAIRSVAELGYQYAELAGYKGNSPEDIKSWLDKYGVRLGSTHTQIKLLELENIEQTIREHQMLDCNVLIIPNIKYVTQEDLDQMIDTVNYAQPILAEAGITLVFHNHFREFARTDYGVIPFDELKRRTSIKFQVDVFWVYNAGLDPLKLVTELGDRVYSIHLRDGIAARHTENQKEINRALGEGEAPLEDVRDFALRMGLPMVVESGGFDPTGYEECARCMAYLRSLEK